LPKPAARPKKMVPPSYLLAAPRRVAKPRLSR
jgi:hypothetical protein